MAVQGVQNVIFDGSFVLAAPVAVAAGLLSFLSPCVLPLVPGYLSYVTGLSGEDLQERKRGRMLAGAALFVLGFTAVFASAGAFFGEAGSNLLAHREVLDQVLGSLVIVLGLFFAGSGLIPKSLRDRLERELRFHHRPSVGLLGAPLLGVLFGIGWTPCMGPTLAAVQTLAVDQATAGRGAALSIAYCLGLGIPFLIAALAFRRALGAFGWVKRHYAWVMRIGGGMLVVVGILLVSGAWSTLIRDMQGWVSGYQLPL